MPVMQPQTFVSPLLFRKSFDVCEGFFHFSFFLGKTRMWGGLLLPCHSHSLLPQCIFFLSFQFSAVILKPGRVLSPQFLLLISSYSSLPKCSAFAANVNLNNLINNSEQQEHQEAGYSNPLNLVALRGSLLPASRSTNIPVYNNNHSP